MQRRSATAASFGFAEQVHGTRSPTIVGVDGTRRHNAFARLADNPEPSADGQGDELDRQVSIVHEVGAWGLLHATEPPGSFASAGAGRAAMCPRAFG